MKSVLLPLSMLFLGFTACSNDDDKAASTRSFIPQLTPIYDQTTPTTLQGSAASSTALTTTLNASTNLKYFFERNASSPFSGENRIGVIRGALQDVDDRMVRFTVDEGAESGPVCVSETPTESNFTADTGTGHSMALKFGCYDSLSGGDSLAGAGSAAVYGEDTTNSYIGMVLTQTADTENQRFGFFATINKTTEVMDFLFIDDFDGRRSFYRIQADPATDVFQFSGAGVRVGYGPDNNYSGVAAPFLTMQGGTRIVSSGTHVLVQGTACGTGETGECQAPPVELDIALESIDYTTDGTCFAAADFTEQTDLTNCAALTFSSEMTLAPSTTLATDAAVTSLKASLRLEGLSSLTAIN